MLLVADAVDVGAALLPPKLMPGVLGLLAFAPNRPDEGAEDVLVVLNRPPLAGAVDVLKRPEPPELEAGGLLLPNRPPPVPGALLDAGLFCVFMPPKRLPPPVEAAAFCPPNMVVVCFDPGSPLGVVEAPKLLVVPVLPKSPAPSFGAC